MKRQFAHLEIKHIDKRPENWTSPAAWPAEGLYKIGDETGWIAMVAGEGVNLLYQGLPTGTLVNSHPGTEDGINESLLLKAIAAASRAEVLK